MYYVRGSYVYNSYKENGSYFCEGVELPEPKIEYIYLNSASIPTANISDWNQITARAVGPDTNFNQLFGSEYTGDEPYELVIAKVTFYADFIVPYKSAPIRSMARNFGDTGSAGFSDAQASLTEAGFRALQVDEELLRSIEDLYLNGTDIATLDVAESMLENSTQIAYTTYYAIAL
jgi:hypothetical protein